MSGVSCRHKTRTGADKNSLYGQRSVKAVLLSAPLHKGRTGISRIRRQPFPDAGFLRLDQRGGYRARRVARFFGWALRCCHRRPGTPACSTFCSILCFLTFSCRPDRPDAAAGRISGSSCRHARWFPACGRFGCSQQNRRSPPLKASPQRLRKLS